MTAWLLLFVLILPLGGCGSAAKTDVPFVGTPQAVVDEMLRLAEIREGDVLYDLGSGDGRIPITAAKRYGIRAVGVELDPQLVARAKAQAMREGVAHLVQFRRENLFATDFPDATVVTLYLLPEINLRLRPKLLALRPGARVVSHQWGMGDWNPDRHVEMEGERIYLWTVPAR